MTGSLRLTILGCGSSGGVPRFGGPDGKGEWGACDPNEPRNRRSRCSVLVERKHADYGYDHDKITSFLIDTAPDMREQLLRAQCSRLDGVAFTHDHADQCHGIDDLRVFAIAMQKRIPVFVEQETAGNILSRFDYCFKQTPGSSYPAILEQREMPANGSKGIINGPSGEIAFIPFLQYHGAVNSLGFRIGDIAYTSDAVGLPEESFATLHGVKVWIVDALQPTPHKTHAHLDMALEWIAQVKPERAILTNMHVSMDYQTLKRSLPDNVEPAYDGLVIES